MLPESNKEPFWRETIHNQHRRSYWHDYHEKGLYMITMVIEGRKRLLVLSWDMPAGVLELMRRHMWRCRSWDGACWSRRCRR